MVNFSHTVNELSAILPPKHNNNNSQKQSITNGRVYAALRGGFSGDTSLMMPMQMPDGDPSRGIVSHEVNIERGEDGSALLDDIGAADDMAHLHSSFARRQHTAANRPPATFNPFRSKSTPPLTQ